MTDPFSRPERPFGEPEESELLALAAKHAVDLDFSMDNVDMKRAALEMIRMLDRGELEDG